VVTEADEDCTDPGIVAAQVSVKRNLSNAQIVANGPNTIGLTRTALSDISIETCLYRAGKDWKIRSTKASEVIRWGVTTSRFNEIIIPDPANGIKGNVTCKNVGNLIFELQFIIIRDDNNVFLSETQVGDDVTSDAYNVDAAYGGSRKLNYITAAVEAHEMVHIEDRMNLIQSTWLYIDDDINACILGSTDTMSEKTARREMKKFIAQKKIDWYILFRKELDHQPAYSAGARVAKAFVSRLMEFQKSCPQ
jgi:hypothetical protein